MTKENGRTYVWVRKYVSLPGLGQTAVSEYNAEKLQPQDLPAETTAAWIQRDGKRYYLLNQKYTTAYFHHLWCCACAACVANGKR
ncbi:hypothetical protein [Paenibacillus albidus]|uniref:hypothetical protein n=1 Tax=Paenibacillus albidus TaxID=2041023 RepID=UPI00357140AF